MYWSISELKVRGKRAFQANYWPSVLAALILTLTASGTSVSSSGGFPIGQNFIKKEGQSIWQSIQQYLEENPAQVILIISGVLLSLAVVILLKIFLFNPLEVGCCRFFRKNVEAPAKLKAIGEGFGDYGHVFGTLFRRDLFIWLWSLLFVIPGIIKSYSWRMVPFSLRDEPELSAKEVLLRSQGMMRGHKWHAFLLDLSFLGWILLGLLTFGVLNLFWTQPYIQNTNAALYLKLRGEE